ncbi:hypothetical protein [Flammeovirga kamogawensis]|uniref:Uncharacterized protein n=1 Tax=Flammeovirga kamogawensis TaxID=373891 RepID=A0ABX8GZA5_9BACT|nr:hypothetical protein [Flammeovirga kamogawensis]MBB6459381.1 hypothetical protein [Flammeovirga kamogawensis]QWG08938.1 hypothetical protein KM029_08335 [Flammeovirga kamogawensis]TRX67229.1 hypothetical protein EO216_03385 [Flammeovirga kamogawensis]
MTTNFTSPLFTEPEPQYLSKIIAYSSVKFKEINLEFIDSNELLSIIYEKFLQLRKNKKNISLEECIDSIIKDELLKRKK